MRRTLLPAVLFSLACADQSTVTEPPAPELPARIAFSTASYGDTTLHLYLNPSRTLTRGDTTVFVHLGVSVGGRALSGSSIFARFSTSNAAVLNTPHGYLLDDDRTRLYPGNNGTARISAEWPVNGKTYRVTQDFTIGGSAASPADTTIELYLKPERALTVGDNEVFVHARVLVGGVALPASQLFTTFTSGNSNVISLPHGYLLDDERTRVVPVKNGTATLTAHWTVKGKTYRGTREFTVGETESPGVKADTVVELYLKPDRQLTVGDNSVFVHARVLINGTARAASQTFTTFSSGNSGIIAVPNGSLLDDDRTQVYPIANGKAVITANWTANGKTYRGTREFTVSAGSSQSPPSEPPPSDPAPPSAPPPSGSYSTRSPHWSHIRTRVTDFYHDYWTNARRDTAAGRFDLHLAGNRDEWTRRNPSVNGIVYRLHWTIIQPSHGTEYRRMQDWYAANSGCRLEDAFLHRAGTSKTQENRLTTMIWGSPRWVFNPGDACWRRWSQDQIAQLRQAGWTGVFYDEYDPLNMSNSGAFSSLEISSSEAYYAALRGALSAERAAHPGAWIVLNTAEYMGPHQAALIDAAGGTHLELFNDLLHGDMVGRWAFTEQRLARGVVVEFLGRRNWRYSLPPDVSPGNYRDATLDGFAAPGMYRQKMGELASYYMIRPTDPSNFYFDTNNDNWKMSPTAHWLKAQEVDVGSPTESRREAVNATGPDGQRVSIWQRNYTKALVLARVTTDWTNSGYGDRSAYRMSLPSAMRLLRHDGTLGPLVNEVWLRKGEAAILIK